MSQNSNNTTQRDHLDGKAEKDLELIKRIIDYLGAAQFVYRMVKLRFLAGAWGVTVSEAMRLYDQMYENARSFDFIPYMSKIKADYEAFRVGIKTIYDWSEFDKYCRRLEQKYQMPDHPDYNPYPKPHFVQIASREAKIRLYFNIKTKEKALLRLALGGADPNEMEVACILYEAMCLLLPTPF